MMVVMLQGRGTHTLAGVVSIQPWNYESLNCQIFITNLSPFLQKGLDFAAAFGYQIRVDLGQLGWIAASAAGTPSSNRMHDSRNPTTCSREKMEG
jgi:hypothetical protein